MRAFCACMHVTIDVDMLYIFLNKWSHTFYVNNLDGSRHTVAVILMVIFKQNGYFQIQTLLLVSVLDGCRSQGVGV